MPKKISDSNSLKGVILTGIVSLIVGIAVGLILNYFSETLQKKKLEYEVVSSESFSGSQQKIAILALEVSNNGKKELEDLSCNISWQGANLLEHKIVGISDFEKNVQTKNNSLHLISKYFNPNESFSLQLLMSPTGDKLNAPVVEIRAKGIKGTEKSKTVTKKSKLEDLFGVVLAVFSSLIAFVSISFKRKLLFSRHSDDQRDIVAFIAGKYGFSQEADKIRFADRRLSYWGVSDYLTEQCVNSGDEKTIERGINALCDLVNYAGIAEGSQLIIHFNIAKLYCELNNSEKIKEHISKAKVDSNKILQKRIQLDPNGDKGAILLT